jgi:hypothetical protein
MKNKILVAGFLAVMTLAQGCIIYGGGNGGRSPGNVTFFWTFYGGTCSDAAVTQIHVTVTGETLENNGLYGCLNGGDPGITLHDFRGGTYPYVIEGLNNAGNVIYRASGSFAIDGNTTVQVDLTPLGQPTSYAYLSWSFPANWASSAPTCSDATVTYVDVRIDNGVWSRYDCATGTGGSGAQSVLLDPGTHHVEYVAVSVFPGNFEYDVAQVEGDITTTANQPTNQSFTLAWTIGGTNLGWQLKNGSSNVDCTTAGVDTVYVQLREVSTGNLLYDGAGDPQQCNLISSSYRYLRSGSYDVLVTATGTGSTQYSSDPDSPPRITIANGVWRPGTSPEIVLNVVH